MRHTLKHLECLKQTMYFNDFRTAAKSRTAWNRLRKHIFNRNEMARKECRNPEPSKDAFSGRKFLEFSGAALTMADASAAGAVPQSRCGKSQT
jgi:hypothetical protein